MNTSRMLLSLREKKTKQTKKLTPSSLPPLSPSLSDLFHVTSRHGFICLSYSHTRAETVAIALAKCSHYLFSPPTLADDILATQEYFAVSECGKQKHRKGYSQADRNEEEAEEEKRNSEVKRDSVKGRCGRI